jgi:hypothetical protein
VLGELRVQRIGDAVRAISETPAEVDDQLAELVELDRLRVLAGVDQQPPEEGRAAQAVARGRDRVAEEPRSAARPAPDFG